MYIRTVLSSAAAVFLIFSSLALAVAPLEMEYAVVLESGDPGGLDQLVITGHNFRNGGEVALTLGGTPLKVISHEETTIIAEIPADVLPGSYVLIAWTGNGSVREDSLDLTIGAEGPQGPQGPAGADGQDGTDGTNGQDGSDGQDGANCYDGIGTSVADCIGPQGLKGETGDKGDTGPTGPQGPEGLQGPEGPQGPQGIQGPPGAVGPQGPVGPSGISTLAGLECGPNQVMIGFDASGQLSCKDITEFVSIGSCESPPVISGISILDPPDPNLIVAGQPVTLGINALHADAQPLRYITEIAALPIGSDPVVANPGSLNPSLIPDFPGDYLLRITVSLSTDSSCQTVEEFLITVGVAQVYNIDYAALTYPTDELLVNAGVPVYVYGQVLVFGLTDQSDTCDESPGLVAEVGVGSNPDTTDWVWSAATCNQSFPGNNGRDEYVGEIVAPLDTGLYLFGVRFSGDGGQTWTYGSECGTGLPSSSHCWGTLGVL